MVVAEVPLWVIHADEASTPEGGAEQQTLAKAAESLAFLETKTGSKKVAIYSVDVHPEGKKFATGGGDGKVRLWNTSALFAKYRGNFAEAGKYESSDSSSGAEDMEADEDKKEGLVPPTAPSSQDKNVEIHDLNQLVRRKNNADGASSTPSTKPKPTKESATTSPSSANRTAKPQHSSQTRLLCALSAHTGSSVLTVRFSPSGRYLASAGDDAVVCIYAPTPVGNTNLSDSLEQWSRIKLCRGHTLDVVGLAWAPDDSHLVSCSLDSDAPIIVWKLTDLGSQERATQSNVLCNPYKILGKNIHKSTVKGVTFDPAGSYVASSGDDPAVCVWRAHDDWGLEKRIDAESGIFRKWKDSRELSSQTLFRRLSWSTDGTYICSTNASVKNKHVASTISREGWSVSSAKTAAAAGAATLVGHKQPVVVSRHCPCLIDASKKNENGEKGDDDEDDDDIPDYATLVALGDKRGFVTVWSTKKSKPIFKMQCSESRCTVTDLAWGKMDTEMLLMATMLDGQVVALRFAVPRELGTPLSDSNQNRVFQMRYGIDLEDNTGLGGRRVFVGDHAGPKLIENALQFALEDEGGDDDDVIQDNPSFDSDAPLSSLVATASAKAPSRAQQSESFSKGGKKRIRPVLMSVDADVSKRPKMNGDAGKKEKKKQETVDDTLEAATKVASAAEEIATLSTKQSSKKDATKEKSPSEKPPPPQLLQREKSFSGAQSMSFAQIPHSTNRIHSVDLPSGSTSTTSEGDGEVAVPVAACGNDSKVPKGSAGSPLQCVSVSISQGGRVRWRDEIVGTSCSAIAATTKMMAVGTTDGTVYFYGTSVSTGWSSGIAFRSHPPIIIGQAIVSLEMKEIQETDGPNASRTEILVVSADGKFGAYEISPSLKLLYKGTILPAMTHMVLASSGNSDAPLPKLARIQSTESGHLLMILHSQTNGQSGVQSRLGPGGALQAFVYNKDMELWLRISDSRFILSDFYSTLPAPKSSPRGILCKTDDSVRHGAMFSSIKPSKRGRVVSDGLSSTMYSDADSGNAVTRSHCEDRLACALALASATEFQHWLKLYVRTLAAAGNERQLRLLTDLLLGSLSSSGASSCWWLSSAPEILGLERVRLVKNTVIPEMSKNRALQRLTNETMLEIDALG